MGYKIFTSYKYSDRNVAAIEGGKNGTARDYVDWLQVHKYSGDDLNKAEIGDEDLSEFKDETIRTSLKNKIWDSSITLVLISPNMVDKYKRESDQWISWEIAYSLRAQHRADKNSLPNAIIAVVLPDYDGNYDYFIDENVWDSQVRGILADKTFDIIYKNMFKQEEPDTEFINGRNVYFGDPGYISVVKWKDFVNKMHYYFDNALDLREKNKPRDIYKK